jgi:peptidoglycan hydrolase-like protein with peptidoglycan-binding domain
MTMMPTVRLGSLGDAVKALQSALNRWRDSDRPRLIEDGFFGLGTNGKVREFQSAHQLAPDGVVGPVTWEALRPLIEHALGNDGPVAEGPRIVLVQPRPATPSRTAARAARAWTAMPSARRDGVYRRARGS